MQPTEKERLKAHDVNRELLAILAKGKGKEGIDELDNVSSSTPLMVACEILSDIELVKILCEAGADVNSVNNENKMPLTFVKERIDKKLEQGETSSEELSKLKLIYDYLE
jgi:ankyrin repeat protein